MPSRYTHFRVIQRCVHRSVITHTSAVSRTLCTIAASALYNSITSKILLTAPLFTTSTPLHITNMSTSSAEATTLNDTIDAINDLPSLSVQATQVQQQQTSDASSSSHLNDSHRQQIQRVIQSI